MHDHGPQFLQELDLERHNLHPASVLLESQLPQPYEQEGGPPVSLLSLIARDIFADPWNSEYAHKFPSSVRLGVLVNTLNNLETLLNIPH